MPEIDPLVAALARHAGLAAALAAFPDDVAAAAAGAATTSGGLAPITDPRAEPWPPMRMA